MDKNKFNGLLKKVRDRESAFREIYEYFLPKIKYRVATKYGNRVDFEDVAHDLFTRIIRLDPPPEVENPTAWIYKICDNIVLDAIRKTGETVPLFENTAASASALGALEDKDGFFSILAALKPDEAEIVRLIFWDGYNLKEAAVLTGVQYGAARQRYSRALKKLKKILQK